MIPHETESAGTGAAAARAQAPHLRGIRYRISAALLILYAAMYVGAEAISASAWRHPAYSYAFNYISDLGVPDIAEFQGRMVDSPLHAVMNAGFILHGAVFLIAALLIRPAIVENRPRRAYLALAIAHALGISLVGLFHGSQAAVDDGTAVLHGLGALLAIGAGNAAAIVAGTHLLRHRSRGVGATLIGLGSLGILAFGYLLATTGTDLDGIPERIAVYTVMAAEVLAGIALLASVRRQRRQAPSSTPPSTPGGHA